MRRSLWGILCVGLVASALPPRPAMACSQPPPNPPVWILAGEVRPEGQVFWIIFHDYSTFGAGQGQFCACGLAIDDPSVQVLGVEVIDNATNQPLPGFSFSPDPNVAASYGGQAPGNWVGFLSPILATIPPGLSISLHFQVLLPPSIGFKRGDADCDGCVTVDDASLINAFLFQGGPAPCCLDAADADDNGVLQLSDVTLILNFVRQGGPPPAPPGPNTCGIDPTPEFNELGCEGYPSNLCDVQCQQGGGAGMDPNAARLMAALQRGMVGTGEGTAGGTLVPGHIHIVDGSDYGKIQVMQLPSVPAVSPPVVPVLAGLLALAGLSVLSARRRGAAAGK